MDLSIFTFNSLKIKRKGNIENIYFLPLQKIKIYKFYLVPQLRKCWKDEWDLYL